MKTKILSCLAVLGLFFTCFAAGFAVNPAILDGPDSVIITFSVNQYTNATVWVEDSTGRVIRHLASGVLGPKAPSPFQSGSLAQRIAWDKRDDRGELAKGTYRCKVGLDMRAKFGKIYCPSHKNVLQNHSMVSATVDHNGNVIVLAVMNRGKTQMVAFDRNGNYVRTLYPYPSDASDDSLSGFPRLQMPDRSRPPVIFQGQSGTLLPEFHFADEPGMTVTPQGWLVMANSAGDPLWYGSQGECRRVIIMKPDGTCPRDTLFGSIIYPELVRGAMRIAVSPDGRHVYATGLKPDNNKQGTARLHTVFRGLLQDCSNRASVWLGELNTAGTDEAHFNDPRDLATDAQGNVYVADFFNNRVMVFSPAGVLVKNRAVAGPHRIVVNPNTGDLYVLSRADDLLAVTVTKYAPLPGLDSLYSWLSTRRNTASTIPILTLDHTVSAPLLWIGPLNNNIHDLISLEDNGSALSLKSSGLGKSLDLIHTGSYTSDYPGYIAVDPAEEVLYAGCRYWNRYNIATGDVSKSNIHALDARFRSDRTLYTYGKFDIEGGVNMTRVDSVIRRHDVQGNRIPLPNGADEFVVRYTYANGEMWGGCRGLDIRDNGDLYLLQKKTWAKSEDETYLIVYNEDMTLKRDSVVRMVNCGGGISVDRAGNLFVSMNCRPRGMVYPAGMTGPWLPDPYAAWTGVASAWKPLTDDYPYAALNNYIFTIGSLFKLSPAGGRLLTGGGPAEINALPLEDLSHDTVPAVQVNGAFTRAVTVEGALWQRFPVSPSPSIGSSDPRCNCFTPRFEVDGFGCIYMPDAFQNRVVVVDNNNNEMLTFGAYGNRDQKGEGSDRPFPAIPMAYPYYVQKVNHSVYVSDLGNQQVLRVRLEYGTLFDGEYAAVESGRGRTSAERPKLSVAAFPMPFNPGVSLAVTLPEKAVVGLGIYDMQGRRVRDFGVQELAAGAHTFRWNGRDRLGRNVGAGNYVARFQVGGTILKKELVMVR